MNDLIIEYNNTVPEALCEDIINLFDTNSCDCKLCIPKNDSIWKGIERLLYKSLLTTVNTYKNKLLINITNKENSNLNMLLNNNLYTKDFIIEKVTIDNNEKKRYNRTDSRYNVLNYIFFLNENNSNDNIEFIYKDKTIKPETGKLVLFPDSIEYMYKTNLNSSEKQYVLSGQLSSIPP